MKLKNNKIIFLNITYIIYNYYIKFIDEIKNIIFIGNEEINKLIKEKKSSLSFPLIFINEKKLINVNKIKQLIK
jgi:hypothetical protein